MARRAVGIVRVSQVAGREGDSFASPEVQEDRIRAECARQGLELLKLLPEFDVSGGADLDARPGLGPAVEAIEAGHAEVIVAAYFDRFFRSLKVQADVIERVERAGGQVLAVDFGRVTNATASQWLSATVTGMMAEHTRRAGRERTADAIQRAINRGVPPWPRVTPGYVKQENGRYAPNPTLAPVIREAFERRARGTLAREVREYLAQHGHEMSYAGVVKMLKSPTVLGEIHFGDFAPNLAAHEPIVDRDTWKTVQGISLPKGRNSKSDRLLARLGILRCGTCDSKLVTTVVVGAGGGRYPIYRCQNVDCTRRVTISAKIAEGSVAAVVRTISRQLKADASLEPQMRAADEAAERAQTDLDALIRVLTIVGDEPAAIDRLQSAQAARDDLVAERDRLRGLRETEQLDVAERWDDLPLDTRRRAIKRTLARVTVAPGRGADRLGFEPLGQ